MSETIHLYLGNAYQFDRLVHDAAMQVSPISIATKSGATVGGRSGVVVAFEVLIDGQRRRVQATTTLRLFATVLGALTELELRESKQDNS